MVRPVHAFDRWPAVLALAFAALVAPLRADTLPPYAPGVIERFADPAVRYDTPGLAPQRRSYTDNDELAAALQAVVDQGAARRVEVGASTTGVPLQVLHFSRGPGRPVALVVAQQHGNEPAAGEAALVIARRLADRGHPLAAVLDRIDVVLLARANPDGAALGRRTNAAGLDINRDHLLLRTPEARAVAALATRFEPVLVIDMHEHVALGRYMPRFGAIKRHDMLIQMATTPQLDADLAAVGDRLLREPLAQALQRAGLTWDWYHTNPAQGDDLRLAMGGVQPDLARNSGGLRHAVSVLLESRGFDLGRWHLQRRVHSQVVAVESLLTSAALDADALAGARRAAVDRTRAQACRGQIVVQAEPTPQRREVLMLDPVTGADKSVTVEWLSALELRALRQRSRPCAYWLAADALAAVERLRALGLRVERVADGHELAVERYRETARAQAADAGGPRRLQVEVALQTEALAAPAGSHLVPLDQPLASLAVAALEPDTPFSYVANRVIERLDQVARVVPGR